MSALGAFGGGTLRGSNAVRFAHLDEAGTSRRERYAVVAGVVSHADNQWKAMNQYLSDMADDLVPPQFRDGIIFHAKDLLHGSGSFDRQIWPRPLRDKILLELAKIPAAFDIPVAASIIDKTEYSWTGITNPNDIDASHYSLAFGMAVTCVEFIMHQFAEADEIATVIAEDVPHMRRHAKAGYKVLKDKKLPWQDHSMAKYLPLERIAEQPMFVAKDESSILQISDLIAFTLCRRANGHKDVDLLVSEYLENVASLPEWFAKELGKGGKRLWEY